MARRQHATKLAARAARALTAGITILRDDFSPVIPADPALPPEPDCPAPAPAGLPPTAFSDGGGPTPDQRRRLATMMNGKVIQTAVISDQSLVRFVVATIGLFNKSIKTYSWSDTRLAFEWLGLDDAERQTVETNVSLMSAEVGARNSKAPAGSSSRPKNW